MRIKNNSSKNTRRRQAYNRYQCFRNSHALSSSPLAITQPSDWYSVKRSDLLKRANGLVSKYASLAELLKAVYPDIPWQAEKFGRVPRGFWQDENNVLTKLAEAEAKLAIQQVYL